MAASSDTHAARLTIDYPDGGLDRVAPARRCAG